MAIVDNAVENDDTNTSITLVELTRLATVPRQDGITYEVIASLGRKGTL